MHICFHEKPHMIFKYLKYHKIRPLALYCCICLIVVVVCPFHCGSRSLSSTLSGFAYSSPPGLLNSSLFHITRVTTLPLTAFSIVIAFPLPFFLLPATAASVTRCINRNNNSWYKQTVIFVVVAWLDLQPLILLLLLARLTYFRRHLYTHLFQYLYRRINWSFSISFAYVYFVQLLLLSAHTHLLSLSPTLPFTLSQWTLQLVVVITETSDPLSGRFYSASRSI